MQFGKERGLLRMRTAYHYHFNILGMPSGCGRWPKVNSLDVSSCGSSSSTLPAPAKPSLTAFFSFRQSFPLFFIFSSRPRGTPLCKRLSSRAWVCKVGRGARAQGLFELLGATTMLRISSVLPLGDQKPEKRVSLEPSGRQLGESKQKKIIVLARPRIPR